MFPNFLGFILLVCHKAHLDWPKTVEKPSVAICFVKNRIIPVLCLLELFLEYWAASLACFSALTTLFRSISTKPSFVNVRTDRPACKILAVCRLIFRFHRKLLEHLYIIATSSLFLPTNTDFGHLFQLRWWKLSFELCVPPCMHLDSKQSALVW